MLEKDNLNFGVNDGKVEVTPEMLLAGFEAALEIGGLPDINANHDDVFRAVFSAMYRARRNYETSRPIDGSP